MEHASHRGAILPQPVQLSVPASPAHVRVARLTAAVVAQRLDFDIEEIDEVLVAVDELTNALIQARPTSEIAFRFSHSGDMFVAEGTATVSRSLHLGNTARRFLDVVVDRFELTEIEGLAHFRITKRSAARADGRGW